MGNIRQPRVDRDTFRDNATSTRFIVAFHSDRGFDGIVNGSHPVIGKIVGVQTEKKFGGASGTFTITIKKPPGLNATSLLKLFPDPEGTWVRISAVVDGAVIAVTWGTVDTIAESTTRTQMGARAETYTISGRDIGKVFEMTTLFYNNHNNSPTRSYLGSVQGVENQIAGPTPDLFVRQLIELWVGNNNTVEQVWELPQSMQSVVSGISFYDALNTTTIQEMNEGNGATLDNSILNPSAMMNQTLWDTMQHYCNGLMNELWIDLAPHPNDLRNLAGLRPAAYLRERVFKTAAVDRTGRYVGAHRRRWDSIRTRVLDLGDVQSRQITRGGGANRFNYWWLSHSALDNGFATNDTRQDLGPNAFRPGSMPIINSESMRRHSIRPFIRPSNYLPINDPNRAGLMLALASNWLKRIHDWYGVAHLELTGTLATSRLFPEIRIGERLMERRPDGNIIYYVEGVTHSWVYPGAGKTTLMLTHGEYEGEDLLKILYNEYENPETVTQEDCVELIGSDARLTTFDENDEVLAQIAAGCRFEVADEFSAVGTSMTEEQRVRGGFDLPQGTDPAGPGLVSEGARPSDFALFSPDPEMVPDINDVEGAHAQRLALGTETNTIPQPEADAEAADVELSAERLNTDQPIPVPDDPFAGADFTDDDPIGGILGIP
jgi:hypothetical protein